MKHVPGEETRKEQRHRTRRGRRNMRWQIEMIEGRIETFDVVGGGKLHRGNCVVTNETVSAGQVISQQLDEPSPGHERITLYWRNERQNGTSTCVFEVLDRRPPEETVKEVVPVKVAGRREPPPPKSGSPT